VRAAPPILALALTLLAGCGAERTPVPVPDAPQPVAARQDAVFAGAGLRLPLPDGWLRTEGPEPLVVSVASGTATLAVWRYPRAEPLPQGEAALQDARRTLLAAVRARDPSFTERASRVRTVDGQPAVEVRGDGRVEDRARRIRSVHIFAHGAEIVIDAYAPARHFPRLERDVLRPLLERAQVRAP
jgi:hypothetical protein